MKKQYLIFMAMGFELVGIVLVFLYIGQMIDKTYQLPGYGVAGGLLFGLVIWLIHIFIHLRKLDQSGD